MLVKLIRVAALSMGCWQAMLHAPLLKDQYLGGFHPRSTCQRRECLDCELVRLSFPAHCCVDLWSN